MTIENHELLHLLQALERDRAKVPPSPSAWPTVHHTQMPEVLADSPLAIEWNFYRSIAFRLLAEGHGGKWLLIRLRELLGIWPTQAEADAA